MSDGAQSIGPSVPVVVAHVSEAADDANKRKQREWSKASSKRHYDRKRKEHEELLATVK